jgi:uncharacterized cupredoxin-like copper-binding protein
MRVPHDAKRLILLANTCGRVHMNTCAGIAREASGGSGVRITDGGRWRMGGGIGRRELGITGAVAGMAVAASVATGGGEARAAGGDLSRQEPVEVVVELGSADGRHGFHPRTLRFETGRLYRLVLRNPSPHPHYFTSEGLAASVWTRKVQVVQQRDGRPVTLAEFKGAIREVEVYPGHAAEWWFVPVQAGRFADLRCDIKAEDGKTHAEHGMRGEVVIA